MKFQVALRCLVGFWWIFSQLVLYLYYSPCTWQLIANRVASVKAETRIKERTKLREREREIGLLMAFEAL